MESCIECAGTNLDCLEISECEACSLMECSDCGRQFLREEMWNVEHTCGAENDG